MRQSHQDHDSLHSVQANGASRNRRDNSDHHQSRGSWRSRNLRRTIRGGYSTDITNITWTHAAEWK
jgi:hypothetical protein